jgi:hypothetical protein
MGEKPGRTPKPRRGLFLLLAKKHGLISLHQSDSTIAYKGNTCGCIVRFEFLLERTDRARDITIYCEQHCLYSTWLMSTANRLGNIQWARTPAPHPI